MDMFADVEGLEECFYETEVNFCTNEEDMESCWAWIVLNGEEL